MIATAVDVLVTEKNTLCLGMKLESGEWAFFDFGHNSGQIQTYKETLQSAIQIIGNRRDLAKMLSVKTQ